MYLTQNGTRPAKNALKWEEKNGCVFALYEQDDLDRLEQERASALEYLQSRGPTIKK